ncbi:hypothetical protein ACQ4PT_042693 [Festuca glaucescens]
MNCMGWNGRGLGNQPTVRELRKVVKQEGPSILFVMETKISKERVESLKISLGFTGCFGVSSEGLSGGIALFWSADVVVDVKNFSSCHIDAMVRKDIPNSFEWRFTGFYGAPRAEDRHHSWRFLRTLFEIKHSAWMCLGDFNETLFASEHFSKSARPEWQMRAFREVADYCSFTDLGWSGVEFTWDNGQTGESNVKARLDRAFGNAEFLNKFEYTSVRHIVTTESDHCFLSVNLREHMVEDRGRGARQFRYENVWQTHVDYDQLVLSSWQKGAGTDGLGGVIQALNTMQTNLSSWGAKEFGDLARKGRKLRQKLERMRSRSVGRGPTDEEKAIVKQLRETLRQEEIWMKQRSRVQWLREGDRNTAYFHSQAAQRKRMNKISDLERSDGTRCSTWEENCGEIQSFYQNLYLTQGYKPMEELLDIVPNRSLVIAAVVIITSTYTVGKDSKCIQMDCGFRLGKYEGAGYQQIVSNNQLRFDAGFSKVMGFDACRDIKFYAICQ